MIEFRSDNSAGVAPEILDAIATTNVGSAIAYGDDETTERLHEVVRDVFEHPSARVFPVTSGTAANALALSATCPPWGAVLCHDTAHILNSEAGATSLLGSGAVMHGVDGDGFRMAPDALRSALSSTRWGDPHHSQPSVVSFTQPSDLGTVYTADQVCELTTIGREYGLRAHLDGARFANALVSTGSTPADMSWRAGVDVLSLGATKNGALSCEAIITFDDSIADELVYRTKRSGHVTSKMRFQSAQMIAYLTDDLWLRLAANSNARMAQLVDGLRHLGVPLQNDPQVNMAFVELSDEVIGALEQHLWFYRMGPGVIRLVTSWQTTESDIETALRHVTRALNSTAL